jgi:hypothetical protein
MQYAELTLSHNGLHPGGGRTPDNAKIDSGKKKEENKLAPVSPLRVSGANIQ